MKLNYPEKHQILDPKIGKFTKMVSFHLMTEFSCTYNVCNVEHIYYYKSVRTLSVPSILTTHGGWSITNA